jgi:hypothetical protein
MKHEWTDLEFADWTLLPSEAALLANKTGPTRLGFAVLLKFFQYGLVSPNRRKFRQAIFHRAIYFTQPTPRDCGGCIWQARLRRSGRWQVE